MDNELRIFSFGGGVQSTAVMVLAAQGKVEYDAYVFANVGNDSESPETLKYMELYMRPYAKEHNINLVEVQRTIRGKVVTLREYAMADNRSIPILCFLSNGAPGSRICTVDFKIKVIEKYAKELKVDKLITGLGISIDEIQRARTTEWYDTNKKMRQKREYPLIDLMMTREDCRRVIKASGLPIPPPSSCYFCPYKRPKEWMRMRENDPELFNKAVELDYRLREKRDNLGRDAVWLHQALKPLDEAVAKQTTMQFYETDICESGYCMT